jgi:LmbE family N-acetylglucosaminyl deacetylase
METATAGSDCGLGSWRAAVIYSGSSPSPEGGLLLDFSDEHVPVRRPHFGLRDRQLYFLLSRRAFAVLGPEEATLWSLIDGVANIGQLRAQIPEAREHLRRLWTLRVCELVPPRFPSGRRRLLVIEPHMDDAALSVGGLLWRLREECEITLLTVAGQSNFTSYYYSDREYFDVATVSSLRKAESELLMRLLGGRHTTLDLPEAPLRCKPGNWTRAWYRAHRKLVDAYITHGALEREVEAWSNAIADVLASTDAEEIWLPLGVGSHVDHELTRNSCLRALSHMNGIDRQKAVFFYQEVPYAREFPEHTQTILAALRSAGGRLEPSSHDVGDAFSDKLRLVSIFGSQFKMSYMAPQLEEAAALACPTRTGRCELRFEVKQLPRSHDPFTTYSGRERLERLLPPLAAWYRRHREARQIRVLSIEPLPHWEDLSVVMSAFPSATIELHAPAVYASDERPPLPNRIDLRPLSGSRAAWLARLAKVALSRPRPTIFLPGAGWDSWLPLARAALAPSHPFISTRMNDLAMALEIATARPLESEPRLRASSERR